MELGYFNSRVRGQCSRLLGALDYGALLKAPGVEDYLAGLAQTTYGPYIDRARATVSTPSGIISRALAWNLSDTFSLLGRAAPAGASLHLKALIHEWEAYSLKAVMRGVERGASLEEMLEIVIPAGEFSRPVLATLIGSKGIPDLVGFLETWGSIYARPLREGVQAYMKRRSLLELELRLDAFIQPYLLSRFKGRQLESVMMREYLSLRIDVVNMMTLMKTAGEGYSRDGVMGFFVEGGGHVKRALFDRLAGVMAREDVISGLAAGLKYPPFRRALAGADPEEPWLLQETLEKALHEAMRRATVTEPLSFYLAASYLGRKVREIKNLRLIARAKVFGIPDEEVRRYLF